MRKRRRRRKKLGIFIFMTYKQYKSKRNIIKYRLRINKNQSKVVCLFLEKEEKEEVLFYWIKQKSNLKGRLQITN